MIGDGLFDETTEFITSDTGGVKGVKTCRYELIPWEPLAELAKAYEVGGRKYGDDNYLNGYSYGRSFGAMMRHGWRFMAGQDYDPDTGVHHLALAAWHCFTMMTFQVRSLGTDDRYKQQKEE